MTIQRCECGHQQRMRAARPEDEGTTTSAQAAAIAAVGAAWASFAVGVSFLTAAVVAALLAIWTTAAAVLAAKTSQSQAPRASAPAASARRHIPRQRYGLETKLNSARRRFSFVASIQIIRPLVTSYRAKRSTAPQDRIGSLAVRVVVISVILIGVCELVSAAGTLLKELPTHPEFMNETRRTSTFAAQRPSGRLRMCTCHYACVRNLVVAP